MVLNHIIWLNVMIKQHAWFSTITTIYQYRNGYCLTIMIDRHCWLTIAILGYPWLTIIVGNYPTLPTNMKSINYSDDLIQHHCKNIKHSFTHHPQTSLIVKLQSSSFSSPHLGWSESHQPRIPLGDLMAQAIDLPHKRDVCFYILCAPIHTWTNMNQPTNK